jgi:RNA polymerase sigma factor (TIGR02999 family)
MSDVLRLLNAANRGERLAAEELLPLVYRELRQLAAAQLAQEKSHSLSPTALVHEAYLRLVGDQQFDGRGHFFSAAAESMRRILVDQARRRNAEKRGGGKTRVPLESDVVAPAQEEELLALNEALEQLEAEYPEHATLVKLRYFVGLSADEAAAALGISPSTGDRRWTFARAWLKNAMK